MHDVRDRTDLEVLLRRFYERAMSDDVLGPVFAAVGTDLDQHLPAIASFWERVLLGTGSYDGRVMAVHRGVHEQVRLSSAHFARWLELWEQSLAELFVGPVAARALERAQHMGRVMLRDVERAPDRRALLPLVAG